MVVKSYIERGEPIASQFLVVHCNFDLSPATIRNDFQELAEEGYLYKFHISSGRVPTDKAWKYFVKLVLEEKDLLEQCEERWKRLLRQKVQNQNWDQIIEFLSEASQSLGFCYLPATNEVKKSGLKYLFSDVITNPFLIPQIAESLDKLDEEIKKIKIKTQPLILIGHENPLIASDNFSALLTQSLRSANVFGILGQKRMSYEKNIALLNALREQF